MAVEVEELLAECGLGGDRAAYEGKQESGNKEDTHRSEWVSVVQGGERRDAVGGNRYDVRRSLPFGKKWETADSLMAGRKEPSILFQSVIGSRNLSCRDRSDLVFNPDPFFK